jgi:hypothetical protein
VQLDLKFFHKKDDAKIFLEDFQVVSEKVSCNLDDRCLGDILQTSMDQQFTGSRS